MQLTATSQTCVPSLHLSSSTPAHPGPSHPHLSPELMQWILPLPLQSNFLPPSIQVSLHLILNYEKCQTYKSRPNKIRNIFVLITQCQQSPTHGPHGQSCFIYILTHFPLFLYDFKANFRHHKESSFKMYIILYSA